MVSRTDAARVAAPASRAFAAHLSGLTLTDLRVQRRAARGQWELAQLRARQSDDVDEVTLALLRDRVDLLTDELISRYEANPELIDTVLGDQPAGPGGRP
jgi:hypothetical protein